MLEVIDNQFSKMGLLYNLSTIPKSAPDDICEIHSLSYNIALSAIQSLIGDNYDISDNDAELLIKEMESALYEKLLEVINNKMSKILMCFILIVFKIS